MKLIILHVLKYLLNIIITCHFSMENFLNSGPLLTLGYSVFKEKFPVSLWRAYKNHLMDFSNCINTFTYRQNTNTYAHIFPISEIYIFLRKYLTLLFRINNIADHCAWYEYVIVLTFMREILLEQKKKKKKKPRTTD